MEKILAHDDRKSTAAPVAPFRRSGLVGGAEMGADDTGLIVRAIAIELIGVDDLGSVDFHTAYSP
jgi:hypothetical protein